MVLDMCTQCPLGSTKMKKPQKNVEVIVQCIKEWWWKTSSGLQLSTSMLTECVYVTVKSKKTKKQWQIICP